MYMQYTFIGDFCCLTIQIEEFDKHDFLNLDYPIEVLLDSKKGFIADFASVKSKLEEEDFHERKDLLEDPDIRALYKQLDEKRYQERQKINKFSY